MSHNSILNFNTRTSNNILHFTMSSNKIIANKSTIAKDGPSIKMTTSVIKITKTRRMYKKEGLVQKS